MKKKTGKKIPLAKPFFNEKEGRAVSKTLKSGWVTQGPRVAELEQMFADFVGAKHAIATSSATTALFLSLHILGIKEGDEVMVPSFSFIASSNVVVHTGATPVFIDVDPRTYNIDPEEVKKAITKKTKAIIPVDQVGLPCDLVEIKKIAKENNLKIVEDAACAIGSEYKGKKIGSICEITCFSFHPRKVISTGDGGIIATNKKTFAHKARLLRNHGMGTSPVTRHKTKNVIHEKYTDIGYNFRLTDIQAAVGVEQMKKLPQILKRRIRLGKRYDKAFFQNEFIIPPYIPQDCVHNRQTYIIRLNKKAKVTRDQLMQKLLDRGISTRRGVMASHMEPCYRKLIGKVSLPETEKATKETIAIPLYSQMTDKEQDYVIENLVKLAK